MVRVVSLKIRTEELEKSVAIKAEVLRVLSLQVWLKELEESVAEVVVLLVQVWLEELAGTFVEVRVLSSVVIDKDSSVNSEPG